MQSEREAEYFALANGRPLRTKCDLEREFMSQLVIECGLCSNLQDIKKENWFLFKDKFISALNSVSIEARAHVVSRIFSLSSAPESNAESRPNTYPQ